MEAIYGSQVPGKTRMTGIRVPRSQSQYSQPLLNRNRIIAIYEQSRLCPAIQHEGQARPKPFSCARNRFFLSHNEGRTSVTDIDTSMAQMPSHLCACEQYIYIYILGAHRIARYDDPRLLWVKNDHISAEIRAENHSALGMVGSARFKVNREMSKGSSEYID